MSRQNTLADRVALAIREGGDDSPLSRLRAKAAEPATKESRTPVSASGRAKCLLLDVSGSMAEECEPGRSKWDALQALMPSLAVFGVRVFAFANSCVSMSVAGLPRPGGGTEMGAAFRTVKAHGAHNIVLVTDGLPSDEADAIRAAAGLKVDIFYVGPAPRPAFLDRLARATSGSAHSANLAAPRKIVAPIRALLEGK